MAAKKGFGAGQIAPATRWLVVTETNELRVPLKVEVMDHLPPNVEGVLLCSEGSEVSAQAAEHLTKNGKGEDLDHSNLLRNRGGEIPFFGERTILVNILDRSENSDEASAVTT